MWFCSWLRSISVDAVRTSWMSGSWKADLAWRGGYAPMRRGFGRLDARFPVLFHGVYSSYWMFLALGHWF